jgi:ABC-type transport system involved in cytochrome c biogenesis permease component
MTLLPVVERELRVIARRGWTFWGRSSAGAIGILGGAWFFAIDQPSAMGTAGRDLFQMLAFFAFVYALLAGVTHSSDSISVEKREGTLGLLFLTDLRGYDVIFGKLVASSINVLYRLVAVLPLLAVCLLLGGITAGEYWRVVLVLVNATFCSLAVGMWCSSICLNGRRAAVTTFIILFSLVFGSGIAEDIRLHVLHAQPMPALKIVGLAAGFNWAEDKEFQKRAAEFWTSVGLVHGLAWLALGAAAFWLPRAWQEKAVDSRRRSWRGRLERLWHRNEADRSAARAGLLDENPLLWLSARDWGKHAAVWMAVLGGILVVVIVTWSQGSRWWDPITYLLTSTAAHSVLKFWVIGEAPRRFLEDRRSGAMELYLSAPLSVPDLLQGQLRALRRQFLIPLSVLLVADACFLVMHSPTPAAEQGLWMLLWLSRMGFLLFDCITAAWLGMWAGMASASGRTTRYGVWRILVLPWIGYFGALTLWWMAAQAGRLRDLPTPQLFLFAWVVIGVANDLAWLLYARRNLASRFREMAALRPGLASRRRWWQRREAGSPAAAAC